jgi:hypothetical protein
MAVRRERLKHAVEALERLPARSRNSALDFVEYLAWKAGVDLTRTAEEVAEDRVVAKRGRERTAGTGE